MGSNEGFVFDQAISFVDHASLYNKYLCLMYSSIICVPFFCDSFFFWFLLFVYITHLYEAVLFMDVLCCHLAVFLDRRSCDVGGVHVLVSLCLSCSATFGRRGKRREGRTRTTAEPLLFVLRHDETFWLHLICCFFGACGMCF